MQEDPKARAEYRSWVENMLTELQVKAEGRSSGQDKSDPQLTAAKQKSDSLAVKQKGDSQPSVQPAEEPATGSSEGNLGLSQETSLPEAAIQVVPEAAGTSSSSAHTSGEASSLRDGNLGLPEESDAKQADAHASEIAAAAGGSIPRRTTVREMAGFMPDSVRGYRELGISESGDGGLLDQGEGYINSVRKFWPGEMYDPEDLVAPTAKSFGTKQWMRGLVVVKKATNADAQREADFRNVGFLHKFTSETGNLPPRKVTKLQKKYHSHVMRQIKIARNMALLPPEGKLQELMPQIRGRRGPPSAVRP